MRALLHVASIVLMLPNLVFAAAVMALGHAIAGGNLLALLDRLLAMAAGFVDWGVFAACAVLLLLAVAGLYPRSRPAAALVVAAISAASVLVAIVLAGAPKSPDEIPFFLPGVGAFAIAAWLARGEPRRDGPPA